MSLTMIILSKFKNKVVVVNVCENFYFNCKRNAFGQYADPYGN